jgi:alkanesulfonate monooxygenase SsuD/methylene tetrahydromethanopterin reductase-like flavin-dependent oxidoreductase (luciferase family)
MAAFDPEKFEDKYEHYFAELQRAYKNAFEHMNDRYDSELVHAIDQAVLSESEPFYEDGGFRVELPDDPADRIEGLLVDDEKLDGVLEAYVDRIEAELRDVFELEE